MKILEKIIIERKNKGFSQTQMAEKIGIDDSGYSRIERGERELTIDRLAKIAEVLEVDIKYLVDETQTPFGPDLRIKGDKNKTIAGNHNVVNEPMAEYSNGTVKALQEKVNMLEEMLKVKEKLIEEKERTINILLTNPKK